MIPLPQAKRIVVKIGTGVLTSDIGKLDTGRMNTLCRQILKLRDRGIQVLIVSSGAVGLGMNKLQLKNRPQALDRLQACASVGQSILINTWQKGFDLHGITVAQILLTREDLRLHHRHNSILNTFEQLLSSDVIPIVNENDTVSTEEIKFGDNDTLSALVASIVNADILFILSNIPGLIDTRGSGKVLPIIDKINPKIEAMADGTLHKTSVGGMISKLSAAKIAQRAGCGVLIGNGKDEDLFKKIFNGENIGTYFMPSNQPIKSRKRWVAIQNHMNGNLTIDDNTVEAILRSGKSLLASSITRSEGEYEKGDIVSICKKDGSIIAQGQTQIATDTLHRLIQSETHSLATVVIHHNSLVPLNQ